MLKKLKQNKLAVLLLIIIMFTVIIGISYAYWFLNLKQLGTNKIASTCFSLELTKEENEIHLLKAHPITDEEGKELTPYSFTITNTCDMFASYTITLQVSKESDLKNEYVASMLNTNKIATLNELETTKVSDESLYKEAYVLATGSLGSGDSEDYTLRLWMDEEVTMEDDANNKKFSAKVVITASPSTYNPVENGITTLHDAILANEYQTTDVKIAIEKIKNKQKPDFNKTSPIINWLEKEESYTNNVSYTMPDPADVGSGKDYATNLTEINVYVGFATKYTFNAEEGMYYLSDFVYEDPGTIDFNSQNYYVCNVKTNVSSANKLTINNATNCVTMHQVGSYESVDDATINNTYPGKQYTFKMKKRYTQLEEESDKSDKGLYIAQDDYGDSYYYRGSVNNNYVSFAGYYWRIIRINGDGSIRLLYAGETPEASGNASTIGISAFNTNIIKPLYVGYMYGNPEGTTIEEVNANQNDSTIKTKLDEWYITNLSSYSEYLADPGFCNDRTLSARENNSDGVQVDKNTYFAPYDRYYTNNSPTLQCSNAKNDLFTVENEKGNQALTNPIGLITIDELMYAGVRCNYVNSLTYVYSGASYWSMSSSSWHISTGAAWEFNIYDTGTTSNTVVTNSIGIRPVINLKANVEISGGVGTKNNPYQISTT